MNKKWQIYETDETKIQELQDKYKINKLLATILSNRNITEQEKIELFLKPTRNDFHDPFQITDMEIAVKRIIEAIEKKENITIYGDYDVDGITSITVLKSFLKDIGLEADTYIPDRLNEGYGLNKTAIDSISQKGCNLMITVDCGISGIEEIEYANTLGIETIITDHHEPGNEIPNALAVIDNKRKDSKYPFRELAGVGVVFKLIQALGIKLGLKEETYLKYLDIVCIGTISDIVPLIDENRVIAKLGLMLVKQTQNIGLRAIMNSAGSTKVNSGTISFEVAPRINACGRMGHQNEALELLLTNDPIEARKLATRLEEYNKERQEIEKRIFSESLELIDKEKDKPCIVLGKEGWHHGVIGIVSSKITEITYKPSILICFEGEESKGSGRSIPGFDLHEAVYNCKEYLTAAGGHSMAIGLSLKTKNFTKFKEKIEEYSRQKNIDKLEPELTIDAEITSNDIDIEKIDQIEKLEPFGESNTMPVVMYKNLKIVSIRALSEGKHLKLTLLDGNIYIDAIGFNLGNLSEQYQIGDKVDIVGNIGVNRFRDIENVQITLKDIRMSI